MKAAASPSGTGLAVPTFTTGAGAFGGQLAWAFVSRQFADVGVEHLGAGGAQPLEHHRAFLPHLLGDDRALQPRVAVGRRASN
jgi:hypothetical protein